MSQAPVSGTIIPPGGEPAPKKTNWVLIGGIVVVVLGICACAACVLPGALLTFAGPSMMEPLLATTCSLQYPGLSESECSAWASDIVTNHLDEYTDCSNSAGGNANAVFQCLEDEGLAPGQ